MTIDTGALVRLGLGSLSVLYAVNKKPPDWLIIGSLLLSVASVAQAGQELFVEEIPKDPPPQPFIGLSGVPGSCQCQHQNNGLL